MIAVSAKFEGAGRQEALSQAQKAAEITATPGAIVAPNLPLTRVAALLAAPAASRGALGLLRCRRAASGHQIGVVNDASIAVLQEPLLRPSCTTAACSRRGRRRPLLLLLLLLPPPRLGPRDAVVMMVHPAGVVALR